jgi:4'-phosphopantetheinyl transferase
MVESLWAGAAEREAGTDLQVWRVGLLRPAGWVGAMADRLLDPEERARAERAVPDVRRRRLVAQIALRLVLAERLGRPADALAFVRGPLGKPALAGEDDLHFSVSHCGDDCLIAVTSLGPVGVDVERLRRLPGLDAIVARRCAPAEAAALERLAGEPRLLAFYRCWTRKEAYLKATGAGLTALDGVTVSVGERAAILALDGGDPAAWTMRGVDAGEGLVSALVVAGAHATLRPALEAAPWN